MRLKPTLIFLTATQFAAALLTTGIAWYRHQMAAIPLANTGFFVAIGLCVLGLLMTRGARLGDNPAATDMAHSTSSDPGAVRAADYSDMLAGINQGALLIVGGLLWLGLVALAYQWLA